MAITTITAGSPGIYAGSVGGNDGTLVVVVGPVGAQVNALAIDAAGNPTFIKPPVVPAQSMIRVNGANGYGSTNTAIRRFLTVVTTQGTDITYADSATLGGSFTLNVAGVYALSYNDNFNISDVFGISLNTTVPTTVITAIPIAERIALGYTSSANTITNIGVTRYFAAGSVVRAHTDLNPAYTNANTDFTVARVS